MDPYVQFINDWGSTSEADVDRQQQKERDEAWARVKAKDPMFRAANVARPVISKTVHGLAGGAVNMGQDAIDTINAIMSLPSSIIRSQIEGPLKAMLGPAGGQTMADALSQVLGPMMAIPGQAAIPLPPVKRGGTGMLGGRATGLLDIEGMEPRFHGTLQPWEKVGGIEAGRSSNLYGRGTYTTDSIAVASGYGAGQQVYRAVEINPVKFIDAEAPLPPLLRYQINNELGYQLPEHASLDDFQAARYRKSGWAPTISRDEMFEELRYVAEKQGYGGIRHAGGKIMGNEPHEVKIYWHPERDVQFRPMPGSPSVKVPQPSHLTGK